MIPAPLTDRQLHDETVTAITRAAVGESRGGDSASYDYAMELMRESRRRLVDAGHSARCQDDIYTRAHRQAMAEQLGGTFEPTVCTCGKALRNLHQKEVA